MQPENKTTEYKREYTEDIKYTVTAFANSDGGTIYIGINDDGTVKGVENADDTMLRSTNAIRDSIRPDVTMFTECRTEIIEEKTVVCIDVQRGTARPYYLHGKGIRPEGVYVRQGASSVPATETAILNMIKETCGDSYEDARSLNQQLSFEKITEMFSKRKVEFGEAQMRTLKFRGEDGTFTNLAFLLSDQCTHSIKLAVFEGSKKTVFKDRREFLGALTEQLESAYEMIDMHNRTRAEFNGLDRIDMRDYPPQAVREALLNAIVHRDYSFSGSTLISIFDDRMEFVSIGGLVKGISLDDIKLGVSVLRNQNLAAVFYRLHLIEAYGTGIMKIYESYEEYDVKPLIECSSNAFKIILPNTNFNREAKSQTVILDGYSGVKQERIEKVLELCRDKKFVSRADVEKLLGVSQSTAVILLREMLKNGFISKKGNGKNLLYYIK